MNELNEIKAVPAVVQGIGQIIRKGTGEVVDFTFTGTMPDPVADKQDDEKELE